MVALYSAEKTPGKEACEAESTEAGEESLQITFRRTENQEHSKPCEWDSIGLCVFALPPPLPAQGAVRRDVQANELVWASTDLSQVLRRQILPS